jgi:ribonuclease P protein component
MAASPADSLELPRLRRIKQGRDFKRIRTQGRRLAHGCLILNWQPLSGGAASRLGVITSRKIGNAVVRNRARRLLREAYRIHQHELNEPLDLIVVARASIAEKRFREVESDYLAAIRRARLAASAE